MAKPTVVWPGRMMGFAALNPSYNYDASIFGDEADCIAGGDRPSIHHLAIDAAIAVAEALHERVGDREIADAGVGIDVGRGAAHDALDDLEPGARTYGEVLSEKIELAPGRPAGHVEVSAKAQRMDRH